MKLTNLFNIQQKIHFKLENEDLRLMYTDWHEVKTSSSC